MRRSFVTSIGCPRRCVVLVRNLCDEAEPHRSNAELHMQRIIYRVITGARTMSRDSVLLCRPCIKLLAGSTPRHSDCVFNASDFHTRVACVLSCCEKKKECIFGVNYAEETDTEFSLTTCVRFCVMVVSTSGLDAYLRAISRRIHSLMLNLTILNDYRSLFVYFRWSKDVWLPKT